MRMIEIKKWNILFLIRILQIIQKIYHNLLDYMFKSYFS